MRCWGDHVLTGQVNKMRKWNVASSNLVESWGKLWKVLAERENCEFRWSPILWTNTSYWTRLLPGVCLFVNSEIVCPISLVDTHVTYKMLFSTYMRQHMPFHMPYQSLPYQFPGVLRLWVNKWLFKPFHRAANTLTITQTARIRIF